MKQNKKTTKNSPPKPPKQVLSYKAYCDHRFHMWKLVNKTSVGLTHFCPYKVCDLFSVVSKIPLLLLTHVWQKALMSQKPETLRSLTDMCNSHPLLKATTNTSHPDKMGAIPYSLTTEHSTFLWPLCFSVSNTAVYSQHTHYQTKHTPNISIPRAELL